MNPKPAMAIPGSIPRIRTRVLLSNPPVAGEHMYCFFDIIADYKRLEYLPENQFGDKKTAVRSLLAKL
ncbi:hypothetical protein D3C71_1954980 [compost metagenome]